MKKNLFKRGMAGLLSLVMCLTALVGIGTTTAYAAGERAEVYLVSFPRSGDANIDYSGTWGHPNLRYMNGWHSGESKYTTIRAMHSYDGTLTDHNRVLSDYSFSANEDGISFSVSGNQLVITAMDAPSDSVKITANKVGSTRRGIITWTDGTFNQGSGKQDVITYAQSVSDPVQAFLNLKVSYGSAKIVKTSEDGKVDNLTFTVTGNGVNQTVKTNARGEIQIDNLMPGVYTVTEQNYDKYEPQESRRVTVVSGQVSTVNFNNKLKRGNLQIIKSSEDSLVEGVTFHLYGTSLSGMAVDEYAVTDKNGVAAFKDVLISGSSPYTVEEVDTAIRYVVPEAQSAPINWNEVTNRSFLNILKKFSVTVTKSDVETGTVQGDASLAGAVYGIYKGETLVDSYATDKNGQFTSKEYICDSDWTVREITPSEGYLLDNTVHKVGIEPQLYTVEHRLTLSCRWLLFFGKNNRQRASGREISERKPFSMLNKWLCYIAEYP